jgi:predicted nucleotide-binding protein (sugar kinase/HSP70/actin superfamily)
MVGYGPEDVAEIAPLLSHIHWHYAARILEVALVAARTPLLYPVFVTSFKCSPDSIALEYFRRILDDRDKPYLVLQLDDHDSSMGYETRIEAGLRAFRNHALSGGRKGQGRPRGVIPRVYRRLNGRTLLFPAWDNLVIPLVAASLRREGFDARVLEEDPLVIRKSMRHNTGQCIPLNAIAEETMDYVERHALDPARTALWMPFGTVACNFPMFPAFIQSLFQARGGGMERLGVYSRDLTLVDLGPRAALHGYRAALVGGLLRRVGCRLRPYEAVSGTTDRALDRALEILVPAFVDGTALRQAVRRAAELFRSVATVPGRKPKVAIFGDLYVRDNDVMSQGLIHAIEGAGGEVVSTSLVEYWRIVIGSYYRRWLAAREYRNFLVTRTVWTAMERTSRVYARPFERYLGPSRAEVRGSDEWVLRQFGVRAEHSGESFDNLLKVFHLWREHPDLRLFAQANPAFCCPSLVTEAMARDIRRVTGVPVVSLTYDGTGSYRNDAIVPYLRYARELLGSQGRDPARA